MGTRDRAPKRKSKENEEPWIEESGQEWEPKQEEQKPEDETMAMMKGEQESPSESDRLSYEQDDRDEKSVFANGLAAGLGIGCIITFVIMWIVVFFTPQLPPGATYQTMLSIFIYPLIYLLAVGLIALTAGIVREYYVPKTNTGKPTIVSVQSDDS